LKLACPTCRGELGEDASCACCGFRLEVRDGILRALRPERRQCFERFLEEYGAIRHAEGRGSRDPEYYRALPFTDLTGANSAQWRIRAATYRCFLRNVLPRASVDILDLGAGNGWFSARLYGMGHRPVAVDIFTDPLDGLGAARTVGSFPVVEAEFDALPFAPGQFDLAVFNSSLHYSEDYRATLAEALRCLRPGGRVVVLDSPLYRRREDGERMREERHRQFDLRYGFRSDSVASIEYLYLGQVAELGIELGVNWRIVQPWYGWGWHTRGLRAWLARRRPPSRFCILVGSRAADGRQA
jgi:SAM-dependent methyltransferase